MTTIHYLNSDNITARIKSHLNGLTFIWCHKINHIYYIFK